MKQRILVTPRSATKSGHPSLAALTEGGFEVVLSRPGVLPTEEDLLQRLPGCVGYLAGVETISASMLENAKELKAISRNGTGPMRSTWLPPSGWESKSCELREPTRAVLLSWRWHCFFASRAPLHRVTVRSKHNDGNVTRASNWRGGRWVSSVVARSAV